MSEIHFVFEKPEKAARSDKKRSRLVTSCDACRTKKIKCRPSESGDEICEACRASGTRCVYEERDRIRAERGIANFTVAPNPKASTSNHGSSRASASRTSSSSLNLSSYSVVPVKPTLALQDNSNSRVLRTPLSSVCPLPLADDHAEIQCVNNSSLLFDSHRPNYPHPELLPHFVEVFLVYAGGIFPFLDPIDTMTAAHAGTIHPSIANAIAAYAARFSDKVPHSPDGRHLSGDPYLEAARYSLELESLAKIDRVHALILIAWTENGSGRANNFWTYGQSAVLAALELSLGSEDCIRSESSEKSQNRLRMTFWSVAWMELVASSVVGKTPLFNLNDCSTSMPYPDVQFHGSLSRVAMYDALRSVFIAMRALNEASNAGKPSTPSTYRDTSLRQIQYAVTAMRDAINPTLAFNRDNFAHAELGREGYILYLAMDSLIECPRLHVAWTSAVALVDIYLLLRDINHRAPVALSSFFLPISMARGAFIMAEANPKDVLDGLLVPASQFKELNRIYLDHSMDLLLALSSYWSNMLQIKIASQPVALYGTQTMASHWRVHRVPIPTVYLERMPVPSSGFHSRPNHSTYDFYHNYTSSSISIFDTDAWAMQPTLHKRLEIEVDQLRTNQNVESALPTSYSVSELHNYPVQLMYDNQGERPPG